MPLTVQNVGDLIARLQKLDPKLPVLAICENHEPVGDLLQLFVVDDVSVIRAERSRDGDHRPQLKLVSDGGEQIAVIDLLSDF